VPENYRGVLILRVPSLARERSEFDELTWLAIINSHILLLGTPEYVRLEIDRLLTGSTPDPLLAYQYATVRRDDVWWIIVKPYDTSIVRKALMSLSPMLASVMNHSSLRVGTRYGRHVEFEYQTEISSTTEPTASIGQSNRSQFTIVADERPPSRGLIKVGRARYQQWVSQLASRPRSHRQVVSIR